MTLTSRALPTPHLGWVIPGPASIGGNGGWFYDLLRKAGVDRSLAHTLVEFVLRPFEIVLVVALAWVVAHLGVRAMKRLVVKLGAPSTHRTGSPRSVSRVSTNAAVLANAWRFAVAIGAIAII